MEQKPDNDDVRALAESDPPVPLQILEEQVEEYEGPVKIYDKLLEEDEYEELLKYTDRCTMLYGAKSNPGTDPHGHWLTVLSKTDKNNRVDASPNLPPEIYSAWRVVRNMLENKSLITCYMNGHTYGTEGYFHTDTQEPECSTAVLYLTRGQWNPDWGGETVFVDPDGEIQASILPKANRLIVFPSHLNHCARGVTRRFGGIRKTLIFKTRRDFQ